MINNVSHILVTDEVNQQWRELLAREEPGVYETYLRYYLTLLPQAEFEEESPMVFGFYYNTPLGPNGTKTGAIFQRYCMEGKDRILNTDRLLLQRLSAKLGDFELDFEYQRHVGTIKQVMPGDQNYLNVYLFDTPHSYMLQREQAGNKFDNFQSQPTVGYEFHRLCDMYDSKIFSFV